MRKLMLRLCVALVLCMAVLAAVPQQASAAHIENNSNVAARSVDLSAYLRSWAIDKGYLCADNQHIPVTDPGVKPTCKAPGLTEGSHCQTCGKVLVAQEVIPPLAHATETDLGVGPTCTRPGLSKGAHCAICGEVIRQQQEIPALGHTEEIKPAEEPTCTDHGMTEGSSCKTCGEVLIEQETIPALGHDRVTDPGYAATCTEPGLTEGEHCRRCMLVLIAQEAIPALGHSIAEEWTRDENAHWHQCRCGLREDEEPHTDADGDLMCDVCRGVLGRAGFDPDLVLPASLLYIEDEAFMGMPFAMVRLPDGLISIGSLAFADCFRLEQIYIPASVTDISTDAFAGCTDELIIYGAEGSEAQRFAEEKGYWFVAE